MRRSGGLRRSSRGAALSPRVHALLIAVLIAGLATVALGFTTPTGRSAAAAALDTCAFSFAGHVPRAASAFASPRAGAPGAAPAPAEAVPVLLSLTNETNWSAGGSACYAWNVDFATAGLTFGDTQFRVKTDLCAPVTAGYGLAYLNAAGSPIAIENTTSLTWSLPSGPLTSGESLLVSATEPLVQDQLDTNVSGLADGSHWDEQTGMQIVPYSGEWEGCTF